MKKILTLAIALVMVFAIAAPAFAAGWDNPVEPDEFENLALDITALSVEPSTTVWNGGTYNKLENTYPVVAGTKVHAYAEVTIPEDLSEDVLTRIQDGKGELTIAVTNLTTVSVAWRYKGESADANRPMAKENGVYSVCIGRADIGETIYVEIEGAAAKSGKDAKITATLGVYNKFDANNQFRYYAKDGKEYVIVANGREYTVTPNNNTDTGMIFFANSDDQLEMAKVWLEGTKYTIVDSFGEVRFINDTTNTTATGETLTKVQAMMDQICNAMGFTYSGRAYMNKDLIEKNLGTVVEGSDSLVYPTGYVQLVTNDPSVNPPQTGDNASVVGFVMIAVALVAAAAVTVKKVRA